MIRGDDLPRRLGHEVLALRRVDRGSLKLRQQIPVRNEFKSVIDGSPFSLTLDPKGVDGQQALYWAVEGLGHLPMGWVPPDGYPDTADPWRSTGLTLGRWNIHMALAGGWWPANDLKVPNLRKTLLPKKLPKTHGALVDVLAKRLVFRTLPPAHRAAILGFLDRDAGAPLDDDDAAVGWRLPYVVALILDSPSHGIR